MSTGLDAAEALKPGAVQLDLFAGINPGGAVTGASIEAKLNKAVSAFASAEARWSQFNKIYGQAVGGLRVRF